MGSYTFKWAHPAEEVFVTGTFDDWSKSVKLEKKDSVFEKTVELPTASGKIFYKFVVDGNWVTDSTAPAETDEHSNTNNVLDLSTLHAHLSSAAPESSTAHMAGQVPKEEHKSETIPGGFPETPGVEPTFSVNPIPGTGTGNNPQPGDQVAYDRTVDSNVTLDKESYEKSGAGVAPPVSQNPPQLSAGIIPESSLPMGSMGSAPTIQSSGPTSTTAALAADVPKEPRRTDPTIQSSGPTSTSAALAADVPKEPHGTEATIQSSGPTSTTAALAADVPKESDTHKQPTVNPEVQQAIDRMNADPKTAVPAPVTDSIAKAGADPSAAANPTAVQEKSQVEAELAREVPRTDEAGPAAPTTSAALSETAPVASTDISPMDTTARLAAAEPSTAAAPTHTQTQPTVTTGVASAATEAKSAADGGESETTVTTPSKPAPDTPASADASASDKKSKRRSFFGKLKEKFK